MPSIESSDGHVPHVHARPQAVLPEHRVAPGRLAYLPAAAPQRLPRRALRHRRRRHGTVYEGLPNATATAEVFGYQLDERNGLLRLSAPITGGFPAGTYVNVEGYYYTWVTDEDLVFFVENIVAEHQYHRPEFVLSDVSDVEADAIALGSAVEALWSQLIEFARDIDISTPEAVSVPATQRYRQMEDLLFSPTGLVNKYKTKTQMLGIGLEKSEMFHLRRISRTTGRLVPVYKSREWDDACSSDPAVPAEPDQPADDTAAGLHPGPRRHRLRRDARGVGARRRHGWSLRRWPYGAGPYGGARDRRSSCHRSGGLGRRPQRLPGERWRRGSPPWRPSPSTSTTATPGSSVSGACAGRPATRCG